MMISKMKIIKICQSLTKLLKIEKKFSKINDQKKFINREQLKQES